VILSYQITFNDTDTPFFIKKDAAHGRFKAQSCALVRLEISALVEISPIVGRGRAVGGSATPTAW
jgi:hypothetical protein